MCVCEWFVCVSVCECLCYELCVNQLSVSEVCVSELCVSELCV